MTPAQAHMLTEAIADWVRDRSDLRALGMAGSWVRGTARPDSDLDLLILADALDQYKSDTHWLSGLTLPAPFRVVFHEAITYGVVWSCHITLDPAAELELAFAPLDWASTNPVDTGTRQVIGDGFKMIVDKDGRLDRLVQTVQRGI